MKHSMRRDSLGLGCCYYPEHWDRALWQEDLRRLDVHSPAEGLMELPEQEELAVRGGRYILLNYGDRACRVTLRREAEELLGERTLHGVCEMEPYGVWVLLPKGIWGQRRRMDVIYSG